MPKALYWHLFQWDFNLGRGFINQIPYTTTRGKVRSGLCRRQKNAYFLPWIYVCHFLADDRLFSFLGLKKTIFSKNEKTKKSISFPLNFKYKLTKREKEAHVFVSWLYNNGIVMLLVEFLPNFIVNSNLISIYVHCRHLLPLHKSLSYDSKLLYRGCGGPFSCHFEDNNLQRRWHWEGFDNQRNRGCRLPNCVCMPK